MTSYELLRFLDQLATIPSKPNLADLLSVLEDTSSAVSKYVRDIIVELDEDKSNAAIRTLRHNLDSGFSRSLRRPRSRILYADLEQILSELNALKAAYPGSSSQLDLLIQDVSDFVDQYESFLHNSTREDVLSLILKGQKLKRSFDTYTGLSRTVKGMVESVEDVPPEGYEELELLLISDSDYSNTLDKLTAVQKLYAELCSLLTVSTAEYPLIIHKLESGSLWLKIFGESKVIALLTKLIESGAGYLYRTFTTEGRLASIPRQVESVEAVLELSKRLEELGIDTTLIKDNVQKSAVVISSNLSTLLIGSPTIEINEKKFSVGDSVIERYLAESKRLLLGEGGDRKADDASNVDSSEGKDEL